MLQALLRRFFFILIFCALAACDQQPKFANSDITGADYGHDFALIDHNGQPRTLADFKGKVVAIFFGYTQCPDVCPTTMVEMMEVMKMLGADAARVQVLFVTIDPQRDTRELLGQYVPGFDKRFLGLTGTPEQIAAVAKEFKVFYQKVPGKTEDSYTMDHFAGQYVFDRQGRLRLFVRYGQKPEAIAADLRLLLK